MAAAEATSRRRRLPETLPRTQDLGPSWPRPSGFVLGLRSISRRHELAKLAPAAITAKPLRTTIREGFLVGATNPKGLVIFTAVLPTFIDRTEGHATLQLATLGVICGLVAALSDGIWAIASGTARAWLGRSQRRLEWMSAGGGVMMIALGAGLAITGHRR